MGGRTPKSWLWGYIFPSSQATRLIDKEKPSQCDGLTNRFFNVNLLFGLFFLLVLSDEMLPDVGGDEGQVGKYVTKSPLWKIRGQLQAV